MTEVDVDVDRQNLQFYVPVFSNETRIFLHLQRQPVGQSPDGSIFYRDRD
jgi:hypothetical protein